MPLNEPLDGRDSEERFEKALRELRPIAPRVLRIPQRSSAFLAFAAVAALLVIAIGIVAMSPHREDTGRRNQTPAPNNASAVATFGRLSAALRSSDKDLARALDEASPQLLPREHRGTALFELGKE